MCGRYSFFVSKERIQQQLPNVETGENMRLSYNIAPTQHAYVVTNDNPNKLQYITWGLIPKWSNDGKNTGKLINARREGIETKPSFRLPVRKRRCIVPADSFYEWKTYGVRKIPYRILLKNNELLMMAGVWDVWYDGNYAVKTFSIITTGPNKEMTGIHDRMPVLLTTGDIQKKWLSDAPLDDVLELLHTPSDNILRIYRVSEKVNSVKNDFPDLHLELPENRSLFD